MIKRDVSYRILVVMFGCVLVLSASGCVAALKQNNIAISYSEQIQKLPGGTDEFWPENSLKRAFVQYWNLRYSETWRDAYEREAPYFQDIVSRKYYEDVIKGTVVNPIEGIEIRSIQKVTNYFYEIKLVVTSTLKNEKKEFFYTDRWVYAGENWYHVMRDMILFSKVS